MKRDQEKRGKVNGNSFEHEHSAINREENEPEAI